MKKGNAPSHAISGVFVFLLLGIFAVFSTVMVLFGARAYKGTADRAAEHNANRIAAAYLRSMVRADDEENAVRIEDVNGIPAVTMTNIYDDEEYITRLYAYDGMLREWFTYEGAEFEPADGEAVCAADEMTAEISGELLRMKVRNADQWTYVDVALRSLAE
jgi:hypothetical protein